MINKIQMDQWFINLDPKKMHTSFYLIRKSLLNAVSELKPQLNGSVLDLACGVMPYKEYLQSDKVEKYIGIDLEPTEYHNQIKPDHYWDGKKIPFEENSFDFVIATEFLEHYFDTELILNEINRVLKPGGIFFFTVPNLWLLHEVPYDYHRFTPYCLEEHFRNTKFSSWIIKPLGSFNYHFAISFALWYDFKLSHKWKKISKPLFNFAIKRLLQREKIDEKKVFENGQLYSGLYGFVTK